MNMAYFSLALYKDADTELQQKYPDALWFALSSKGMTDNELEAREVAFAKMYKEQDIIFIKQDKEFRGQIVWVGEEALFSKLI